MFTTITQTLQLNQFKSVASIEETTTYPIEVSVTSKTKIIFNSPNVFQINIKGEDEVQNLKKTIEEFEFSKTSDEIPNESIWYNLYRRIDCESTEKILLSIYFPKIDVAIEEVVNSFLTFFEKIKKSEINEKENFIFHLNLLVKYMKDFIKSTRIVFTPIKQDSEKNIIREVDDIEKKELKIILGEFKQTIKELKKSVPTQETKVHANPTFAAEKKLSITKMFTVNNLIYGEIYDIISSFLFTTFELKEFIPKTIQFLKPVTKLFQILEKGFKGLNYCPLTYNFNKDFDPLFFKLSIVKRPEFLVHNRSLNLSEDSLKEIMENYRKTSYRL